MRNKRAIKKIHRLSAKGWKSIYIWAYLVNRKAKITVQEFFDTRRPYLKSKDVL